MKKITTSVIYILISVCLYGQTTNSYWGELFGLNTQIPDPSTPQNQENYYASDYVSLTDGFESHPEGGGHFLAKNDPLLVIPPSGNQTGGAPNNNEGGVVGTIPGSLSVSPSGAAIYSIPLELPPGLAGMTPELGLAYNSQGGEGLICKGWAIQGISNITLAAATNYYDGESKAIIFPQGGKYLLDGKRMIKVNDEYQEQEFRTEIDDIAKIIGYDANNSPPDKFLVKTKSGLKKYYGYTENSKHILQNYTDIPLQWRINRIEDNFGNYIEYEYDQNKTTGESYPKYIHYTGNGSVLPMYTLEFVYEDRDDIRNAYFQTIITSTNYLYTKEAKRLDKIICWFGSVKVKEYDLHYGVTDLLDNKSLTKIYVTGKNDEKFNPILIDWDLQDNEYTVTGSNCYGSFTNDLYGPEIFPGDFNGDGKSDFILRTNTWDGSNYDYDWSLQINQSLGTSFTEESSGDLDNNNNSFLHYYYPPEIHVGDFNGDGLSDFFVVMRNEPTAEDYVNTFKVCIKNVNEAGFTEINDLIPLSDYWFPMETRVYTGDYNGDGIIDVLIQNPTVSVSNNCRLLFGDATNPLLEKISVSLYDTDESVKFYSGDFNGDGKSEIVEIDNYPSPGSLFYLNDENILYPSPYYEGSGLYNSSNDIVYTGDFNGDRKLDFIDFRNQGNTWQVHLSTGRSFELIYTTSIQRDISNDKVYMGDFNGDGRTDIMLSGNYDNPSTWNGVKIYLAKSNGKDFTEVTLTTPGPIASSATKIYIGDFNGNGRTDFLSREYSIVNPDYKCYRISGPAQNLITKITNGIGESTDIQYLPLSSTQVYSSGTTSDYPISDFMAPLYVVDFVKRENGYGSYFYTYYDYKGAKVHRNGKGFLGFEELKITDYKSNTISKTYYSFNNSFFYPENYKSEIRTLSNNILINEVFNSTSFKIPNGKLNFFPFNTESLTKKYNKDGGLVSVSKTIVAESDMDIYGNTTHMEVLSGVSESQLVYQEVIDNIYNNYPTIWVLGRLMDASVVKSAPGSANVTRTSKFEYYNNTWALKAEIVEPGHLLSIRKEYVYDSYGNLITSTVSAPLDPSLTPRVTQTIYGSEYNHRFVTELINSLGHSIQTTYNAELGQIFTKTDPNGLVVTYDYDNMGRLFKVTEPDNTKSKNVLRWVSVSDPDKPDFVDAIYYSWEKSSAGQPKITYFDKLGRVARIVTIGFGGDKIYVDSEYNPTSGKIYKVSEPYFAGASAIYYTEFEYDERRRMKKKILPGNRITDYIYDGLTTSIINHNGTEEQNSITELNAVGWEIKKTDDNGNYVIYNYTSEGRLKETYIFDEPQTKILYEYNILGSIRKVDDPAIGIKEYDYNAFGELIEYKHNGIVEANNFIYDNAGRLLQKDEPGFGTSAWVYDNNHLGLLDNTTFTSFQNSDSYVQNFVYDDLGRVIDNIEIIDHDGTSETFTTSNDYDILGRIKKLTYPSGYEISYKYNSKGYLGKIIDDDNKVLWELKQMNARKQIEEILLGNDVSTFKTYYPITGLLKNIDTYGPSGTIQNFYYSWFDIGNLKERQKITPDGNTILYEKFTYDNLNRLKKIENKVNYVLQATVEMDYDVLGRMLYKRCNDNALFHVASNYDYNDGNTNPYDLFKIDNIPAFYNNEDQVVTYTTFDKIKDIYQGNKSLHLYYGAAHNRVIQEVSDPDNNMSETKIYIGGIYEKVTKNGQTKEVHYLSAGSGLFAIYTKFDSGNEQMAYVHKDHLGSIQALTDETGNLIEEYSYDAWGLRRDPNSWVPFDDTQQMLTDRGYTGHEHLDLFALVNMNGRVYDPVISYFTSPDPLAGVPSHTQDFNPYIYVLNNPLSLVDPSGYSWFSDNWKSVVASMVAITVSLATAGIGTGVGFAILSGTLGGFAGGVTGALLNGGDFNTVAEAGFKGAVAGFMTAGFAAGIGSAIPQSAAFFQELGRAAAHGSTNGLMTLAQGGKFEHGLMAGAFSSLAGSYMPTKGLLAKPSMQVWVAAAVGGTASVLGGGKFANGAITGAYVMMYNHLMNPQTGATPDPLTNDQNKKLVNHVNSATEHERHRNLENTDPYNPEVYEEIAVDFNIDGLPKKDFTGYEFYTSGEVSISVGNKTVNATIIYSPSANPEANIVRKVGDFRTDLTIGRITFTNRSGYQVAVLQFNSEADYQLYRNYVHGGN